MKPPITVLIVEDHPIFSHGLAQVIGRDPTFTLAGQCADGLAAERLIRELQPDIAILDIGLPGRSGLDLARLLERAANPVRLIILSMHKEDGLIQEAMDAGVKGYVLKENALEEILQALRTVALDQHYLSPSLSGCVLRWRKSAVALQERTPGLADLTRMERQVLKLIAENKPSDQIAAALFISPHTVATHRKHICAKLGLHGSHGLIQFALQHRGQL